MGKRFSQFKFCVKTNFFRQIKLDAIQKRTNKTLQGKLVTGKTNNFRV